MWMTSSPLSVPRAVTTCDHRGSRKKKRTVRYPTIGNERRPSFPHSNDDLVLFEGHGLLCGGERRRGDQRQGADAETTVPRRRTAGIDPLAARAAAPEWARR